ncbi:hypothetical protein E2C01_061806 [Portunus trituberculatus]|uniref:Uncharacterized protein n=1 Tax=Portunus trituberculatus TaxID=210409 RepID=A0A5B7HCW3_PORTR|nr:hypothetical protein [Portunus trituberculatus]
MNRPRRQHSAASNRLAATLTFRRISRNCAAKPPRGATRGEAGRRPPARQGGAREQRPVPIAEVHHAPGRSGQFWGVVSAGSAMLLTWRGAKAAARLSGASHSSTGVT